MFKKNSEDGLLVVEASLALFFFTFFMLFVWNFAGIFAAQNVVSHAAMQTVQTIAVDNISREKFSSNNEDSAELIEYANKLLRYFNGGTDVIRFHKPFDEMQGNKVSEVEEKFYYILGGEDGKEVAKEYGIDVNSIEFTLDETALGPGSEKVRLRIDYVVKLRFGVFGLESMNLTKCAECKLFGADTAS